MLREPTFTFTIPSIHDDVILDCRIYSPDHLQTFVPAGKAWMKSGAIVAHPYAPMGGEQDDPVVQATVAELLTEAFVVGTFNFRGAGSSKGRTSWTARPELADYISIVGFLMFYIRGLCPPFASHVVGQSTPSLTMEDCCIHSSTSISRSPIRSAETFSEEMTLVLAGYSYGSLITARLPPIEVILDRFANPSEGSAEVEIKLRALHLSKEWNRNAQLEQHRRGLRLQGAPSGSSYSLGAAVGGEESKLGTRRNSHECRRSTDVSRRSIDHSRRRLGTRTQSSDDAQHPSSSPEGFPSSEHVIPQISYLLISPLLPPISLFASTFSKIIYITPDHSRYRTSEDEEFVQHRTLAVCGDKDFFTSQKKLRKWAEHLGRVPGSKFNFREITGAGHFWREEGVETQLRGCIRQWLHEIKYR